MFVFYQNIFCVQWRKNHPQAMMRITPVDICLFCLSSLRTQACVPEGFLLKYFISREYGRAYLEEVPLSKILTIENKVKQIAPNPANTRAGIK